MTGEPGSLVPRWSQLSPSQGTYIAAVVNEACKVAALGGVDDGVMVYPEHVAAPDAFILIPFLPHVRNHLADVLAHVLNDHLVSSNGLHGKQAPVVNVALTELELLLPKLGEGKATMDESSDVPEVALAAQEEV